MSGHLQNRLIVTFGVTPVPFFFFLRQPTRFNHNNVTRDEFYHNISLQHFCDTASNSYLVSTLIFALKVVIANHLVVRATLPPATEK